MEVPEEKMIKWYNDTIIHPEPFNALVNIISMWKSMEVVDKPYYNNLDAEAKTCLDMFSKFFFLENHISKAKLIYLDKEVLPSILHTDNKLFFRNTGLPVMFINQDFKYSEDILIKGILIANTKELVDRSDPLMKMTLAFEHKEMFQPHLLILALYVDMTQPMYEENWLGFTMDNYTLKYAKDPDKQRIKICKYVSTIACNIIDFMNHDTDTITINTIFTTREENQKRIKRGKPPIPTKVYIKPKSEYRNYYVSFNKELETRHLTHRFLVRGHWRHFRSDKWKEKRGKSVWVKPFIKGKGIFIEKKYKLEGGDNDG